jgi:hypothetical protein
LGKIGAPHATTAVPDLVSLLQRCNGSDKLLVTQALGELGPASKDAVPALIAVLREKDCDLFLETEVIQALGRIGPGARVAEKTLQEIVKENDAFTLAHALHALKLIQGNTAHGQDDDAGADLID